MFTMSGGLGRVYVGYRRIMDFRDWVLVRTTEYIGGVNGMDISITGSVVSTDPVYATSKPTHIALRRGSKWWIWTTGIEIAREGTSLLVRVQGNPEVIQQGRSYYAA